MLHCITNRDDSDEPTALDHWKMAEPLRGHPLHDLVDRIRLVAGLYLARHHLTNRLVADLTGARISSFVGDCAKDIPFSENANHSLVSVSDYHSTDMALIKDRDGIAKADRRRDRDDR